MHNITNKTFADLANKIHNNKYDYSKVIFTSIYKPVEIICPKHGGFNQTLRDHIIRKSICKACSTEQQAERNKTPIEIIKQKILDLNDVYTPVYDTYINSSVKMKFICPVHGEFYQTPRRFIYENIRCGKCGHSRGGDKIRLNTSVFISKSKEYHGDRYDYSKVVYINNSTPVEIVCSTHGSFLQTPQNHMLGSNCHKCNNEATVLRCRHTNTQFISKAKLTHGDKYNYDKVEYINNKTPVTITCLLHGDFTSRPDNHISGKSGCPVCNESKGELKVREFLISNHIEYIREYRFPNSNYRYVFYLPKLNILIEYDGALHFKAVDNFGGVDHLNAQKARDSHKNDLAKLHNVPLIRLHYRSYNELESILLFKLSKYYKYRVGNKYYRGLTELCKGEQLPGTTVPKDVKKYLLYCK